MKLKAKTKKAIRGSITILLVIILFPMMTFSAMIVDMSRVNMASAMISSAGDLTMNTALANYDTILKDVYGLFAMSQDKTEDQLAAELRNYFAKTISSYGVVSEAESGQYVDTLIGDFKEIINGAKGETNHFLEMQLRPETGTDTVSFQVDLVDNSSLANPQIMRKQIVEYMKYRAPMTFGLGFIDALKSFQSVEAQNKVVEAQVTAQESTQDVTKNSQKLIKLIREFDDLLKSIEEGDRVLKGSANPTDGVKIPIALQEDGTSPYSVQLDKYRTSWGQNYNYQYINKINLIFLANSPSLDNVYLSKLKYNTEIYIKPNGAGLIYENSGINVNPTLKGDTNSARQQVYDQISALASLATLETTYQNQDFLATGYLDYNYTVFKDEAKAIETFVAFEKFVLDQNDTIKYSAVKNALEQITILGKYYDNYYKLIGADINKANKELTTAKTNTSNAQKAMNTPRNNITGATGNIYNTAIGYYNSIKEEEEPLSFIASTGLKDTVLSLLQRSQVGLPGGQSYGTNLVPYYTIYNFNGYYNNFKEYNGDADDIYLKYFKQIANSLKGSDSVAKHASSFLSSGQTNFASYMKSAAGNGVTGKDLYKLLNCLYSCSTEAKRIPGLIDNYNAATPGYSELVNVQHQKQEAYNSLVADRNNVTSKYNLELNKHRSFVTAYQADAYYYERYITTAKNIVTEKTSKINTQYVALRDNVKALVDKLDAIQKQITATKSAISTYDTNVDNWEKANNNYVSSNESDSFSDQSSADIKTARSQYNEESFKDLSTYVDTMKFYYETYYKYITDTTHFKYGATKLDGIKTADQAVAAVAGIKSSLPAVVTESDANGKFASLYNGDKTPPLEMYDQMYYLEPTVVQIQILKYLNSTFPEQETQTTEQKTEETSYKNGVKDLANGDSSKSNSNGGSVETAKTENSGKYGYTYKDAKISGDLPSSDTDPEPPVSSNKMNMDAKDTDDGGLDVDTSSGTTAQKNVLSSVLKNISSAVTAGVENLYILTYLFENFSYNTMVQDEVVSNLSLKGTASAQLIEMEGHLATEDNWKKYDNKIKTLSNYPISAKNNYIYGAELEYILYGNKTAKTNITYAKGSIYAIRFGFNCIYAFTNSEIRNTTMSVGLAVQAATLGIVPYQLVQIILQLALAAGEAAIDLEMMNCGLDVAIVKTTDTWALSISNLGKSMGDIAKNSVNQVVETTFKGATQLVTNGIQAVVDATTDKLSGAITDATQNLTTATQKVVQDAIDQAFSHVMAKVEEAINQLNQVEVDSKEAAKTVVGNGLAAVKSNLHNELSAMFAGNDLALKAMSVIETAANNMIDEVNTEINTIIDGVTTEDITSGVIAKITEMKQMMIKKATGYVNVAMGSINGIVQGAVNEVSGTLQGYADQAKGVTEEKAEELKKKVQETTNGYIDKYLDAGNSTAIGGNQANVKGGSGNSVASMMKFGYKEYLMLFMYLGLCVESKSNAILKRTADVIQLNIRHAGIHKKAADFKMKNAYTYVSIRADVELEMFFMDMDFFTRLLSDDETEKTNDVKKFSTITYKGILGY